MSSATFAVLGLFSDAHKIVDAANQIRPRKLGRLEDGCSIRTVRGEGFVFEMTK